VAVIDAAIDDGGLRSLLLSVRHEIAGPIDGGARATAR